MSETCPMRSMGSTTNTNPTMKTQRQVTTEFQRTLRLQEIENEEAAETTAREQAKKNLDFVQFQRAGMRHFVDLISRSPVAAQCLNFLAVNMSRTNMVSIQQKALLLACGVSRATISRAIKILGDEGWLKANRVGATNVYQINAEIFWSTDRDKKGFADIYSAKIKPSTSGLGSTPAEFSFRAKPVPIVTFTPKKSQVQSKNVVQEKG